MSFARNGGRITVSAELSDENWTRLLLALGSVMGAAFLISNRIGWQFVEFVNQLCEGDPHWIPYEIPADRARPFATRKRATRP